MIVVHLFIHLFLLWDYVFPGDRTVSDSPLGARDAPGARME